MDIDSTLKTSLPLLPVLLLSSAFVVSSQLASVQQLTDWDFPRLDELWMVEAYPQDVAMAKAKACEIDNFVYQTRRTDMLDLEENYNWSTSSNPGFHMCYLGINCRDVTPSSSGKYWDYHGRTPGFELYPLNISAFRWALHLLIGDRKEALIKEGFSDPRDYESIHVRLDTVVPPANKFWFNQDIPPVPYDPVEAYNVLTAAGFSNDTGCWICPNGHEMRRIYVMESFSLCTPPLIQNCVKIWNNFFGKMSDGETDYFKWDPQDCTHPLILVPFYNRDHDIYFLCWSLRRNLDYLYGFFHPDADVEGGSNSPGLNHPPLNRLLYMLKYGKDPDTHGLITGVDEMKQICYEAQWHLYNQTPYIPLYSKNYINQFKPGLKCWVESQGYGSAPDNLEMPWTYCSIHWEGQPVGGSINWHVPGDVTTLHPALVGWTYERTILNRIYDSLIVVNPYTHEDVPWATLHWAMEPYANETENVLNGMRVKFWLRNDLYWHDGSHVTAKDIKWNWDFVKRMGKTGHFKPLSNSWSTYIKSKVIHDYLVEVYVNTTGLGRVYHYARNALKFPRLIWGNFWDDPEGAEAFEPWAIDYQTHTGLPPPLDKPDLTCLIGTGPFWLESWDEIDTAHMLKNQEYWMRKATTLQQCTQLAGITSQTQFAKEVDGELIPEITKPFLDAVVNNMKTKANCTFTYEVFMDETTLLASGGPITLDPCGSIHVVSKVSDDLQPCVHEWKLVVQTATGNNTYIFKAAYLIADLNGDGRVGMRDIYLIVKAFGTYPGHQKWNKHYDINNNGIVDMMDIYIAVRHYGDECV